MDDPLVHESSSTFMFQDMVEDMPNKESYISDIQPQSTALARSCHSLASSLVEYPSQSASIRKVSPGVQEKRRYQHRMDRALKRNHMDYGSIMTLVKNKVGDVETTSKILRCYGAIASPGALYDLCEALQAVRQLKDNPLRMRFATMAHACKTLDAFHDVSIMDKVVRRFALISICARRDCIVAQKQNQGILPNSTEILDQLAHESYGERLCSKELDKQRKIMSNRLLWGGKWLKIQRRFSDGIVALFCTTTSNGGVSNSQ